jgi:hypothetical protein
MSSAKHKIGRSKTEPLHPSRAPFNLDRVSSAPAAFGDRARANARIKETAVKKKDKVYKDDRAKREENLNRIIGNFAAINQRFNELDYAASSVSGSAASVVSGPDTQGLPPPFGRVQSQDLGALSPGPPPDDWVEEVQGVEGIPSAPPHLRGQSTGSFGSARSSASTASSVYESVLLDSRELLLSENLDALNLATASAAAAAAVDAGANNMTREQQSEVLGREGNQGLLDNIDAEFDALMNDIINSQTAGFLVDASSKIIKRVYQLVGLIMTAIGKGLGFAIKYPKLAILIIGLGYLQYPLFARIVNFTVGSVWTILQYLFGMTTAGRKIGQFIKGIVAVYNWLKENGLENINVLLETLRQIQAGVSEINESIKKLNDLAESLGLSIEDLIQIVISLQSTFGTGTTPTPGAGQAIWNLIGQFATGAGSGAAQALLGNGVPRLGNGMGGGKRKPKSKTNKKRKSKSNKKGKTKTRRR